jgi:uncharacterized protein (DUF1697 family)
VRTWIALLRGVNVGGHNKVAMAELRALCASLGWEDPATYIQSGNVVFRASGSANVLAPELEAGLRRRFDLDVPVILKRVDDLERVVASNPFLEGGDADPSRLHVGFMARAPEPDVLAAIPDQPAGREELRVAGAHVFLHYPDGVGRSKLTTAWLDRAMGTPVTVRSWRTVNRLVEMARDG